MPERNLEQMAEAVADIRRRDDQDTHRATAPLRQADDAVLVDTSNLDIEQSFAALKKVILDRAAGKQG